MEGASKGGPKPHQQNKPKQNKHQQNQNKKGGGGGGNIKGQGKPANPSSGGPKPQKTETSEVSACAPPTVEPAKVSIESASPSVPAQNAEEVKPTGNEPQEQKPMPQSDLLPHQRADERKDAGKGNQQVKGNKSKSPAQGGPQNKDSNSATKSAQVPPAIPGENLEGVVSSVKSEAPLAAKETIADGGITSTTPQQSVATDQNKNGARGKSPCTNNKNLKGGKGNKGGNPPNKLASRAPMPNQHALTPEQPEKEENPSIQSSLQGTATGVAEVPKATEDGSADPKSNFASNSSKLSKSQGKGGGSASKSGDMPEPVVSTYMNKSIPVESPQSFAEKAKSPACKACDTAQVEKTGAESSPKIQLTQPKNKAGKGGSFPQPALVKVPPAAPHDPAPVESSPAPHPEKIDLPKNQQSSQSKPKPRSSEHRECDPKNSPKKHPANYSSPPAKSNEQKGDQKPDDPKSNQASSPKKLTVTKLPSSDEAVTVGDFEPLFPHTSAPVAKLSHPAPTEPVVKETPKQSVHETLKGETVKSTIEKASKSAVAEPYKPVTEEITKETRKSTAKETAKPIVQKSPKPAVKETSKSVVQETPEPPPTVLDSEDADFDPLFSDLTDSTKVLVGIACPFVDKFPSLIPPTSKPQTPEPQQQSTKSKSPPDKAQTIRNCAPVEIEAPVACLPGSPLQGDMPELWKDKVSSDVKLSSSPKPSSSPKAVEGAQKKGENKNYSSGKKANAPAPLVPPSESAKIRPAVAAPLMPKEPKPDVNEPISEVVKNVANQKSCSLKATQKGAQGASKAPVYKKEDGVCSTKIDDIANMTSPSAVVEVSNRLCTLEKENSDLKHKVGDLTAVLAKLEVRVKELEKGNKTVGMQAAAQNSTVASQAVAKAANASSQASANVKTAGSQAKSQPARQDDDDDGVDLFASDSEEEDEEASRIKEQRLAEYAAKKGKKPALIAKSSVILDVKPWDDETDMKEMENRVRKIEADGLLWGASKLVPLAYGIHKLQINCVVEDEKISIDWLQETIEGIEDYVQSVDIAAFNKI